MKRQHWSSLSAQIALVLTASLLFVVPFDSARNIDAQGLLLIVAGGFAWLSVVGNWHGTFKGYDRIILALLGLFMIMCLASTFANPSLSDNLLGEPLVRLGGLGLLACVGLGLAVQRMATARWLRYFYWETLAIGILSVPYSLLRFHSLERLPGLLAQPVLTAAFLGCGLVAGLSLRPKQTNRQRFWLTSQLILASLLLLTETRVVILIVGLITLWWLLANGRRPNWRWLAVAAWLSVVVAGLLWAGGSRLTSPGYARQSADYRVELQQAAVRNATSRPWLGYGPGNLSGALDCQTLGAAALQRSCQQGYYFNSSHNVFLDRVLALGVFGGLSYLALTGLALWRGWHLKKVMNVSVLMLALLATYYLTNVTSVGLELLYWMLLFRCLQSTDT